MNSPINLAPYNSTAKSSEFSEPEPQQPHLYRNQINIDNLISICSLKLKSNPNHKKALFIRASSYMKKKQYLDAIEDCHALLDIDSRNVNAYYLIGCAHEKLDEV